MGSAGLLRTVFFYTIATSYVLKLITINQNGNFNFSVTLSQVHFSSFTQLCSTLCDPMDCSTPGLPVHHQLLELTQNSCPLSQWCHPIILSSVIPFFSCLQFLPASGSFSMIQFFTSGAQSIGVSASASAWVFPMNMQDWFPLELNGFNSLQSKRFSRVTLEEFSSLLWSTQSKVSEADVFLEYSCFFYDLVDVGSLISDSSDFSKSSFIIWKFLINVLLKSS